ncbi:hypothetical protein DY000_02024355 [Brassica cretica]|uniref:Uncharacterized protein n=1 Tax=Brassica cretica TaxID=69181 RepID=A0ABQ7E4E5_BRACR|nr:hypothetical protein DY000_02024355 [Brassica cretica]
MNRAIETMILAQEKLVLSEFSSVRSLVIPWSVTSSKLPRYSFLQREFKDTSSFKRELVRELERESRSGLGSGERSARLRARAVAGASRFSVKAAITRGVNRHQRWLGCWSKGAVVWRGKRGEVVFIASSVLSSEGEGFHSLASPALVELSGEIDEALCREVGKLKKSVFGGGSSVSSSGETRVSVVVLRQRLGSVTVKSRQRRRVTR